MKLLFTSVATAMSLTASTVSADIRCVSDQGNMTFTRIEDKAIFTIDVGLGPSTLGLNCPFGLPTCFTIEQTNQGPVRYSMLVEEEKLVVSTWSAAGDFAVMSMFDVTCEKDEE